MHCEDAALSEVHRSMQTLPELLRAGLQNDGFVVVDMPASLVLTAADVTCLHTLLIDLESAVTTCENNLLQLQDQSDGSHVGSCWQKLEDAKRELEDALNLISPIFNGTSKPGECNVGDKSR